MIVRLPYGDTSWVEDVPGLEEALVLRPSAALTPIPDLTAAVGQALESPLDSRRLTDLVQPKDTVALIINDATRRTPSKFIVTGIAQELERAGLSSGNVTIVVATGTHRCSSPDELKMMLGEDLLARFEIVSHDWRDASNLVYLGDTARGVPVWINRIVAEASFRIVTGTIAPHHIAGYSGGAKAILPGVAGEATIRRFHSFPIHPFRPALGHTQGNPSYEEPLAGAKMVGVDFMIDAVPDPQGKGFLGMVAGDLETAHAAGIRLSERACRAPVPFLADLTICSPGGYPRDINLHQAQKALSVAEMVTRPGGMIALVAECRKGTDSEFAQWLQRADSPRAVVDQFRRDGWSGSSGKALMFARAVMEHAIVVVSDAFSRDYLESLFLLKDESLKQVVARAAETLGTPFKTIVIPHASEVMPVLTKSALSPWRWE
jgi:nickel-dependent lactate racemase